MGHGKGGHDDEAGQGREVVALAHAGKGEGDDEQIFVDLDKIPAQYDKLIFVVNIYKAVDRKQHFGMIKNAYIRIIDNDNREELCRFNLSDDYTDMLSMIAGEVYKRGDE